MNAGTPRKVKRPLKKSQVFSIIQGNAENRLICTSNNSKRQFDEIDENEYLQYVSNKPSWGPMQAERSPQKGLRSGRVPSSPGHHQPQANTFNRALIRLDLPAFAAPMRYTSRGPRCWLMAAASRSGTKKRGSGRVVAIPDGQGLDQGQMPGPSEGVVGATTPPWTTAQPEPRI